MPGPRADSTSGKAKPKVKVKPKGSVGSAITKAAKGKDVSFAAKPKPGKPRSTDAGVGAKSKGTVRLKKKTGTLKNAATLIGIAQGRVNARDLKDSAPGIVARSTTSELVKDPKRAAVDTAKATVGIPAGLIRAAANPAEAAKAIGKDYSRRYGPALEGDYKKFNERQKKEGITGELFDATTITAGAGAASGRAVQRAAQAGSLGAKAKTVATRETRLRVSGGEGGVRVRKPSKNYWKNSAQNRLDKSRAKKQAKRAAKPQASGIVREAEAANKAAGRVVEVTPKTKRAVKRAQKGSVAHRGGVTLQTMKAEQAREVHSTKTGVAASTRGLTKDERAAWKYQAQYGPKTPAAARAILEKHRERVIAERAASPDVKPIVDELPVIDKLIAKAEGAFTPRLRAAVKTEGNRSRRVAHKDPGLDDGQALRRAHMPAADLLGVKPLEGETAVQFARRARQEGRKQGLGAPAYFKSEEIPKGVHAAFAKGGSRAVASDRAYTGALTRTGRESGDLEIVSRSAAGNIKRRYNWNHVADTVDDHVFPWSKDTKHSAYDLERQVRERGIDPSTVALWNPRLYREAQKGVAATEGLPDADPSLLGAQLEKATAHATASLDDLATNGEQFKQAGWQLAPKDVIDEVMSTVGGKGEGAIGRGYDITKGQISRVLLANPAWLGFQVASNALMSGLAGVTPADLLRSRNFFKKMGPEDKAAAEAIFGVHGWYKEQRRMGAVGGHWTAGWNALKETPFYRRALEGKSPLDALFFRPDNAQNNAFRRALMYSRLKRQAYRELGQNATTIVRAQNRLTGILKGNPEDQMLALARNKKIVEEHAQAVDDFLGNWTRYTAAERRGWSRFVMFYGFLRFATRLAFYTMPVKHPIMSSILLQIGRLEKDEIERIFGTEPPPWEYGNLYAPTASWGENPTRERTNFRVPTTRLVPFFNALTASNPGAPVSMLNPVVGMGLNQIAGKNVPLDQPYTVNGSTAYVQHSGDLSAADRAQIALAEFLQLSPYYRAAEAAVQRGKQSSDSSLLFPQPVQYSTKGRGPEAKARNDKRIAEQNARGVFGALQETLAPQIGTGGNSRIDSARSFAQSKGKKPKVKVKQGFSLGGGSSSSSGFKLGGGSSGGGFKLGGG